MQKKTYQLHPLGDQALVISWQNTIDRKLNQKVHTVATKIRESAFPGIVDIVPAYSSITVFFDVLQVKNSIKTNTTAVEAVGKFLENLLAQSAKLKAETPLTIELPVCYDSSLYTDIDEICKFSGLSPERVIKRHASEEYYVYMAGFLPGFVYMGDVSSKIAIPRKQQPVPVKPGAVAIAGRQTGVYPVHSPGGWHIIGYTPLRLFDAKAATPALLQPGNLVRIRPIELEEYKKLKSKHKA